jgi:hypothetical protein
MTATEVMFCHEHFDEIFRIDLAAQLMVTIRPQVHVRLPNQLSILNQLPSQEHENHNRLSIKRDKVDLEMRTEALPPVNNKDNIKPNSKDRTIRISPILRRITVCPYKKVFIRVRKSQDSM